MAFDIIIIGSMLITIIGAFIIRKEMKSLP